MPDIIKLLPDALANQIAAGEVIQRPASMVKELVENAIDAKASKITLLIKDAGKALTRVVDNGIGMTETDARMSFERHATSKIMTGEDLFKIKTKGFRGEALASIAAVAEVEMKTRVQGSEIGTRLVNRGSKITRQEQTACPEGTDISVKQLFYNIPARRKFLKSDSTEVRHIINEFQRIVIAHPKINFEFYNNDKLIFSLPSTTRKRRIVDVLGNTVKGKLITVEEETELINITGFVTTADAAKRTRDGQFLFVNNRYFKSAYFNHAVTAAYESMLQPKMFPPYVLFLEIDPADIDVNVHPTKQEIKFENERAIYNFIKVAVRHRIAQHHLVPVIDFGPSHPIDTSNPNEVPKWTERESKSPNYSQSEKKETTSDQWESMFEGMGRTEQPANQLEQAFEGNPLNQQAEDLFNEAYGQMPEVKNLQQILQSYIIAPTPTGFMMIDQYAAHVRILYEQFKNQLKNKEVKTQSLAFPETIELNAADAEFLNVAIPQLKNLGYDISPFGQNTFVVHGLPVSSSLSNYNAQSIQVIIDYMKEELGNEDEFDERIAIAMAQSSAIRKGRKLENLEMVHLVENLMKCSFPDRTPLGKYCYVNYNRSDIEKRF